MELPLSRKSRLRRLERLSRQGYDWQEQYELYQQVRESALEKLRAFAEELGVKPRSEKRGICIQDFTEAGFDMRWFKEECHRAARAAESGNVLTVSRSPSL